MEITLYTCILFIVTGFTAGFVDSIAGGGGIITVPALLAMGFDPHLALGTNKLQACLGSVTASVHYARSDLVDIRRVCGGIFFTAIGALLGAVGIQFINAAFLEQILPVLLVMIFLYLLFSPDLGRLDCRPTAHRRIFYLIAGLALGFYDGFFGPGVGSFWMVAFVVFLGHNLRKAAAHTKVMNATSNVVSFVAFFMGGKILIVPGLLMGVGQLLGASLGARLVIRRGTRFVRVFLLCVVAATIGKLLYSTYWGDSL